MNLWSLLVDLVLALVRGCLIGVNDFLIATYLVIYHDWSWTLCGTLAAVRGLATVGYEGRRLLKRADVRLRST